MAIKQFCCLIIPELSNKHYSFLGFLIGSFARKCIPGIIADYILELRPRIDNTLKIKYLDILGNIISDVLTGILHCYLIKKDKKENSIRIKNNEKIDNEDKNPQLLKRSSRQISLIFNDETQNTKLLNKIIFCISFIDFLCQLCFYYGGYFTYKEGQKLYSIDFLYSFLVIDIVARYFFSRFILKTYFYFHHYLSTVLNIIVLFVFFWIELAFKIDQYNIYFLIISLIQYVLYSLEDILNKVALIKLYIYPESLLFYKGLYSLVYFFIFTLYLYFAGDLRSQNNGNKHGEKVIGIMITRLIFIIFNIIRSVYLVKVIDIFSSQYISLLKVLETIVLFGYYFIDKFYKKKNIEIYKEVYNYLEYKNDADPYLEIDIDLVEIIACLILLFISLIHNEIIIINCHKLKRNTKYYLTIVAELEDSEPIIN